MAIVELKVPDIGNFDAVDVIEVLVAVGDVISVDQTLLTLESDKASMDVPAEKAGTLVELLVKVGDKIKEGDLIARIESAAESAVSAPKIISEEVPVVESAAQSAAPVAKESVQSALSTATPQVFTQTNAENSTHQSTATGHLDFSKVHASPSVRAFARELGADLTKIQGTGQKSRVLREDVTQYIKNILKGDSQGASVTKSSGNGLDLLPWPKVDFSKFGAIETQPLSRIKKISGANLSRNWAMIPHVTQFDETDVTELENLRVTLNKENEKTGQKVTILAFLIKACVKALQKFPEFNSSLDGDQLVLKQYYHIGFAADTPNGLVVPVIRDCDQKSVTQLAQEMAELAKLAREGKLKPDQMQGGCFTISSLGGIGGTAFTPIINAPEVAILGVSRSQMKPVWTGKEFVPRLMLPLSLSYDHRVIDGALGARFISYLNQLLADMRRALV